MIGLDLFQSFCFSCRLLDRVPDGPVFIALCFIVRSIDAVGFAGAMTSTVAMMGKIFPNNVATVLVSAGEYSESRANRKSILVGVVLCVPRLPVT